MFQSLSRVFYRHFFHMDSHEHIISRIKFQSGCALYAFQRAIDSSKRTAKQELPAFAKNAISKLDSGVKLIERCENMASRKESLKLQTNN